MSGLERITEQIIAEATANAQELLSQAEAEAEKMTDAARLDGETLAAGILEKAQAETQEIAKLSQSAAVLEGKRELLKTKQRLISGVINEAQERLASLPDAEYFAVLKKMVMKYAQDKEGQIAFSSKDIARLPQGFVEELSAQCRGSLSLAKDPAQITNGFLLIYGGIEENCSFTALFDAAREELQDLAGESLFS